MIELARGGAVRAADDAIPTRSAGSCVVDDAREPRGLPPAFRVHHSAAAERGGDRAGVVRDGGGCRARQRPVSRGALLPLAQPPPGALDGARRSRPSCAGLARGERDFGVVARVINCSLRHYDPAVSLEIARLSVAYRDRGVVAFDLAGGEAGRPRRRASRRVRPRRRGPPRHHGACRRGRGRGVDRRGARPLPRRPDRPRHPAVRGSGAARLRARPPDPDRDQHHQQRADPRRRRRRGASGPGATSTQGSP